MNQACLTHHLRGVLLASGVALSAGFAMSAGSCAADAHTSVDVAVVGGGLSGLLIARGLAGRGKQSWVLLEADSRLGGRIRNSDGGEIDLGPAWIWPEHQPKIRALVKQLGLQTFAQPDDPSSTRIAGGSAALIQALAKQLPEENVKTGWHATKCAQEDGKVRLTSSTNATVLASTVVFAAPPKLLSKHVEFSPGLAAAKQRAMEASRTWMAGVTKVALMYPNRFWPLNGRASNSGLRPAANRPAFQVYDGSSSDDKEVGLTFFTVAHEHLSDKDLAQLCAAQLAEAWEHRGLGGKSKLLSSYERVHVMRWPHEGTISDDRAPGTIHPHPEPVRALAAADWEGQLQFASSESDLSSPGVMEGAVGAAHRVLSALDGGAS
jgi:monoamine oxidase